MHLFHDPQYTIQNINVHISVLNGALWDMEQVHYWICELDQFWVEKPLHGASILVGWLVIEVEYLYSAYSKV